MHLNGLLSVREKANTTWLLKISICSVWLMADTKTSGKDLQLCTRSAMIQSFARTSSCLILCGGQTSNSRSSNSTQAEREREREKKEEVVFNTVNMSVILIVECVRKRTWAVRRAIPSTHATRWTQFEINSSTFSCAPTRSSGWWFKVIAIPSQGLERQSTFIFRLILGASFRGLNYKLMSIYSFLLDINSYK